LADRREKKARTDRFPIGFWLKNFTCSCYFFELRPRQILDPHRGCYLGYILVSVGFRFRLVRYSGNLLSSRDAKLLFIPRADRIFGPFLEEKSALEDFQTGQKDGLTGSNSVPEAGPLFAENGTDRSSQGCRYAAAPLLTCPF
jgi:hypothetical protein